MPRWLARALARIHAKSAGGLVHVTTKAQAEARALHLGPVDIADLLANLSIADFDVRFLSDKTAEWMYVFKPSSAGVRLYVKVMLRERCVVVSCHEDGKDTEPEASEERNDG